MGWRTIGMISITVACVPAGGSNDEESTSGSTAPDETATTSIGTTEAPTTGIGTTESSTTSTDTGGVTTEESGTEDTGATSGRCVVAHEIDTGLGVPNYVGSASLVADVPERLLFVESDAPLLRTTVVGAATIDDAWAPVQILDDMGPIGIADIDGDARDDVVFGGDPTTWWSPDASGELALRGPIEMSNLDALVTLPGRSTAALVRSDGELEIHAGNGDGTFAAPVLVPPPEDGYDFWKYVREVAPGIVWAERWAYGCPSACGSGGWILDLTVADAELIATTLITESFIGLGHFDDDGMLDVFVQRETDVQVRRAPDFDFNEPLVEAVDLVQVGDFDGDGATDVIVSNSGWVGVYWNDGGAVPAMPMVLDDITLQAPVIRASDVERDGDAELVVGDYSSDTWRLLHWSACD